MHAWWESPSIPFSAMVRIGNVAGGDVAVDDRAWRRLRSQGFRYPTSPDGGNDRAQERSRNFLLSFAELSALIAVVGGLIYLLGIFAFVFPISRVYTKDFSMTWHATSLVPKTVVAGHGLQQMLIEPLLFISFIVLLTWALGITLINFSYLKGLILDSRASRLWSMITAIVIILVVLGGLYFFVSGVLGSLTAVAFSAGLILLVLPRWFFTLQNMRGHSDTGSPSSAIRPSLGGAILSDTTFRRQMIVSVAIIFFVFFAGNATIVYERGEPPVLPVEITRATIGEGEEEITHIRGSFLAHTEGFWYMFDQDDNLIAVPDSEIKKIQISASKTD